MDDIHSRATVLQGKLDYIKTNLNLKAVKLYSASKYPASHIYKDYTIAVQPKLRKEISEHEIYKSLFPTSKKSDSQFKNSKIENGQYAIGNLNMQEKLQFYYVNPKPTRLHSLSEENDQNRLNVSSIDSLLLFDQKEGQNFLNTQSVQNDNKDQIEDAPDSILQPWHSLELESPSTYLYAPTLGEV